MNDLVKMTPESQISDEQDDENDLSYDPSWRSQESEQDITQIWNRRPTKKQRLGVQDLQHELDEESEVCFLFLFCFFIFIQKMNCVQIYEQILSNMDMSDF